MPSLSRTVVSLVVVAVAGFSVRAEAAAPKTEEEYAALMSNVGSTFQSLQKTINSGHLTEPAADARKLAAMFTDVEQFWSDHGKADAVKWAGRARLYSTQISGLIAAAERPRATAREERTSALQLKRLRSGVISLGTMCKQCHTTYRIGDEASGYQFKPGVLEHSK